MQDMIGCRNDVSIFVDGRWNGIKEQQKCTNSEQSVGQVKSL